MVHYEAKKNNVVGERYKYSAMEIFRKEWLYTLPLIGITIFMLAGYSPGYSAIVGLAVCIGLSFKDKGHQIDPTLLCSHGLHGHLPVGGQIHRPGRRQGGGSGRAALPLRAHPAALRPDRHGPRSMPGGGRP